MRGEDQAEILVQRGNAQVVLRGALPKEKPVIEQRGLVISGALFGMVDPAFQADVRSGSIMVNFVDEGGVAENAEVSKGDFLASFDGVEPKSLEELSALAQKALEKSSNATLLLRRVNAGSSGLFGYVERSLPIRDFFWVDAKNPFGQPR